MQTTPVIFTLEWFNDAFGTTNIFPTQLRKMSERLCREFNIRGICDPSYIANIAAYELGSGDGCSNFSENPAAITRIGIEKLFGRLRMSYSSCINDRTELLRSLLIEELMPTQ